MTIGEKRGENVAEMWQRRGNNAEDGEDAVEAGRRGERAKRGGWPGRKSIMTDDAVDDKL